MQKMEVWKERKDNGEDNSYNTNTDNNDSVSINSVFL